MFAVPLLSATWISARRVGAVVFAVPAVVLALVFFAGAREEDDREAGFGQTPWWETLTVTAIAVAPALLLFVALRGGDFPFLGDGEYHLVQSGIAAEFWATRIGVAIAAVTVSWFVARSKRHWWILGATILLIPLLGLLVTQSYTFPLRYPGLFYFFASPLSFLPWRQPIDAMRILNLVAIPLWLLVLRPLVIRVSPTIRDLPLLVFVLWQKEVVFYFTSAYLEPWMLVLILLATEHLIRYGGVDSWKPLLLTGTAAMIKEQAIFVLPFFAAAAWFSGDRAMRRTVAITTVVAATPFFVYAIARRSTGVFRTLNPGFDGILTPHRMQVWTSSMGEFLGPALLVALFLIGAMLVLAIKGHRRAAFVAVAGAAAFQIAIFFFDRQSVPWTGYPRFHLVPLFLLAAPLFEVARRMSVRKVAVLAIAVAALQSVPLSGLLLASRDPIRLNLFELSPVVYPLREALAKGEKQGMISPKTGTFRVLCDLQQTTPRYDLQMFSRGYPDLANRLASADVFNRGLSCRCETAEPTIALFTFRSRYDWRPPDVAAKSLAVEKQCLDAAASSCSRLAKIEREGQLVALVAAGARQRR